MYRSRPKRDMEGIGVEDAHSKKTLPDLANPSSAGGSDAPTWKLSRVSLNTPSQRSSYRSKQEMSNVNVPLSKKSHAGSSILRTVGSFPPPLTDMESENASYRSKQEMSNVNLPLSKKSHAGSSILRTAGSFPPPLTDMESENATKGSSIRKVSGLSPLYAVRMAEEKDVQKALTLENTNTRTIFGEVDVNSLIQSCICKSLVNKAGNMVAFIALKDHPNLHCMTNCQWENWAKDYYRLKTASPWNTLFIWYFVWDHNYQNFFENILKSLYKNNVHLEHILLLMPPGNVLFRELKPHFTQVIPEVEQGLRLPGVRVQTMFLNLRFNVITKLIIRKAAEEDNIDVQPILKCQYDDLKCIFGDFKLGSVIKVNDSKIAVIVGEQKASAQSNITVGVMSMTSEIDYQLLHKFFHVPLPEFDQLEPLRLELSQLEPIQTEQLQPDPLQPEDKNTLRHLQPGTSPIGVDLFSLSSSAWEELEARTQDGASLDKTTASSGSAILLKDGDSEFRIVDPAMKYLVEAQKKFKDEHRHSQMTAASSLTFECGVGRPSFSPQTRGSITLPMKEASRKEVLAHESFTGPQNAFKIMLYAFHPDLDLRYAFDLLEASFECYPDKHYCFLSLPTSYQGSPLTKHFVRLTPRLSQDFPYELYIVHRNSIFSSEFRVRPLSMLDCDSIQDCMENISESKRIMEDILSMFKEQNPSTQGFALECEGCFVGFAIVNTDYQLEKLSPHFRLEEAVPLPVLRRHGLLRHAILNPIFLTAARFFLRQILHQCDLDTICYCHSTAEYMAKNGISEPTLLGELHPVSPRPRIQYDLSLLDEVQRPDDYVLWPDQEFSFFVTSEKLLSIPILELNYRIVIVGSSDVALSFLEHLIFGGYRKHVRYNNLMLVSLHGLPLELKPHLAVDKMNPHNGRYSRDYLVQLSLETHVNIMYGAVGVINRKEKMVCINNNYWMRYDYLFLFTGTQFCRPRPENVLESEGNVCQKHVNMQEEYVRTSSMYGDNLFVINTTADAAIAFSHLKKLVLTKKTGKVLVYGNCINTFTCVESLLTLGVPGNKIVLLLSPDSSAYQPLGSNDVIEKAVTGSLELAGVSVYQGFKLVDWIFSEQTIHRVMFRSETNIPLTFDCVAIFCFGPKTTSTKTYSAVTDCGIMYNCGIIIDNKFCTNDKFIFAAGPGTKYSQRYGKHSMDHGAYSSIEVGKKASLIFRQLVEPQSPSYQGEDGEEEGEVIEEERKEAQPVPLQDDLPLFTQPKVLVASLPGGWNYMRVSAPGPPVPHECQLLGQGDTGLVLITGDPVEPEGPGYFQLTLSAFNTVREIVCLSMQEIPYLNLQCLYGKHEKLLNNLLDNYSLDLIPDLYAFFGQPWAYALYTSGFDDFEQTCCQMFKMDKDIGVEVMKNLEPGTSLYQMTDVFSEEGLERLEQQYASSSVPRHIEHLTMKYVQERTQVLPMYVTDTALDSIRRTYSTSPLHRPPKDVKPRLSPTNPYFD